MTNANTEKNWRVVYFKVFFNEILDSGLHLLYRQRKMAKLALDPNDVDDFLFDEVSSEVELHIAREGEEPTENMLKL